MTVLVAPTLKIARDKRFYFELVSRMVYKDERKRAQIHIPKGFRTDFASIPRALRVAFPVNGHHRIAAVLHDYLYSVGGRVPCRIMYDADGKSFSLASLSTVIYSRKESDKEFKRLMRRSGVGAVKAQLMYRAVRLFGWAAWKK